MRYCLLFLVARFKVLESLLLLIFLEDGTSNHVLFFFGQSCSTCIYLDRCSLFNNTKHTGTYILMLWLPEETEFGNKGVSLYWVNNNCNFEKNWTSLFYYLFNTTCQTSLSWVSVPGRFELNIINLLLAYCILFAGYLLLSFYFTGILLLGEILSRISVKWLDVNTITTLSDFFISRLVSLTLWLWIITISSQNTALELYLSIKWVERKNSESGFYWSTLYVWSQLLEKEFHIFLFPPDFKLVNITFCSCNFLVAKMERDQYLGDKETKLRRLMALDLFKFLLDQGIL
jgi:hypothetical protein